MKKVIITQNKETSRFEATDIDGVVHYTAAKKADLKTSLKRSKKHEFEIVEEFETIKDVTSEKGKEVKYTDDRTAEEKEAKPIVIEPVKDETKKPTTTKGKPAKTTYENYKQHIITNFTNADLHSKADKIAAFCKKFDLTLSQVGRNLTFEKTLTKMVDDGIIEYTIEGIPTGKYKKLTFQYTSGHNSIMSPDEDEEL